MKPVKILISIIFILLIIKCESRKRLKNTNIISQNDKAKIVDKHNNYRNQIASKSNTMEAGIFDVFATNMMQMYWNEDLTDKAQQIVDQCLGGHSTINERKFGSLTVGENLLKRTALSEQKWDEVIDAWFSEILHFRNKNIQAYVAGDARSENFSQMIWANSYMIGCGYALCSGQSSYLCLYGPTGNIAGHSVFIGAHQHKCACPEGTKCGNRNYQSLCCPDGYCSRNNLSYNGQLISGTLPHIK
jgi:hypothetical protein